MAGLAQHVGEAIAPLRLALSDRSEMEDLLRRLGVNTTLDDGAFGVVDDLFGIDQQLETIATAVAALATGSGEELQHGLAILDAAAEIAGVVAGFTSLTTSDLLSLPAPLDDPATWTELAADLAVHLLVEHLRRDVRGLFGVLGVAGVLAPPPEPRSPTDQRLLFHFDRLLGLVADPGARLADQFGWPDELDADPALWWIREVCHDLGLTAEAIPLPAPIVDDVYDGTRPIRPAISVELVDVVPPLTPAGRVILGGLVSALGPVDDPGGEAVGFYVGPMLWGSAGGTIELGGDWAVDIDVDADASGLSGLSIRPGSIRHETSAPALNGSLAFRYDPDDPIRVLGGAGVEVMLHGARVGVSVDELQQPTVDVAATGRGLELRVGGSEADSFINALLGSLDVSVELPVGLDIGPSGIALQGGVGLEITRTVDAQLGPFTITTLRIALVAGSDAIELSGTLGIGATLGPFTVSVDGLGANLELVTAENDSLGLGVTVRGGFVAPTAVAFEIESESISGGGIIKVDGDRYVGGLTLDVMAVGIDAFTVVDTSLPGDPAGFALFATLSLRFPGIPLGFGFSLTGLGGLLALNRSIDAEALALGLRDGAADSIMFPEDPVRDSDLLVAALDDYFPIWPGNTVVGPLAEVTWGPGGMITGQLGVVVSFPQGAIVVLGSLEAILPDEAAPVLELHLDTLGAIDLVQGTVLVVASLYDSRLLGTIELSGDAALYVSVLDDPYFVLSVGGFHPGFQPPAHAPALLESLRRMRAEVQIGLGVSAAIEAYFAVTSNTVQFGGGVEVEASADFLLATYTARGWFEFDVLIRFSPFLIVADASAGVGVYANDKELLGVDLSLHLEGPDPWYASGTARFTFFLVEVKFDFAVGGRATPVQRASANVLDLMVVELSSAAAWTARHASGTVSGLQLAGDSADALIRPDDVIVVRQTIAPLGYPLDKFGEATPEQNEVTVESVSVVDPTAGVGIGEIQVDDDYDWFASAQYTTMSDTDRLSAPSYELLTSGVTFGVDGVGLPVGDRLDLPAGHETEVWQPAGGFTRPLGQVVVDRAVSDVVAASAGARVVQRVVGPRVDADRIVVEAERYVVVDGLSGRQTSGTLAYAEAVRKADPANERVVPAGTSLAGDFPWPDIPGTDIPGPGVPGPGGPSGPLGTRAGGRTSTTHRGRRRR